ncbi:MAG: aspartate carbamoyltransferase catalytic subunit [Clostridiales bacterium]|nr:aspartate carbamoyltransferase catalytic subunit [Clostridiales bacterium]
MEFLKDVLGIKNLSKEQMLYVIETAKRMKLLIDSPNKKSPMLQGKTVITLFYENSTRTRMSFELAAKYMSGNVANISVALSSIAKGETLLDTGKTLDMMGTDVIVMRHPQAGAANFLAKHVNASIINAGDGMNEHPTQALLDIYTILEKKQSLNNLKIAIIGDIAHSRVARSNIYGMTKLGANVFICAPDTLLPKGIEKTGAIIVKNKYDAVNQADVVMGLRLQKERMQHSLLSSIREYHEYFGLSEKTLSNAKDDVLIMHPGPVNRGVEMTSKIIDGTKSVITEQVKNGVAIRMALLYIVTRRSL